MPERNKKYRKVYFLDNGIRIRIIRNQSAGFAAGYRRSLGKFPVAERLKTQCLITIILQYLFLEDNHTTGNRLYPKEYSGTYMPLSSNGGPKTSSFPKAFLHTYPDSEPSALTAAILRASWNGLEPAAMLYF